MAKGKRIREPLVVGGTVVKPGERVNLNLPVAALYTQNEVTMPVTVIQGKEDGPRLFICAAVHGDELNGVEIIRRVLKTPALKRLRGTLIAVPVVNVFGFIYHSRYLPDRRDLNRFFPGSDKGSMTSRLADLFMREIAKKCTHGIDLHTGAIHRPNFPHIRANLKHDEIMRMAKAFGTPVILDTELLAGSLREAVTDSGTPVLVYEAGEALRFDEPSIRYGVRGILNVMRSLGMLSDSKPKTPAPVKPITLKSSTWVRASESGILHRNVKLGMEVKKEMKLGGVADPFGENETELVSPDNGVIIGMVNLPLVYEGDALFHVGLFDKKTNTQALESFQEQLSIIPSPAYYDAPPLV